MIFKCLNCNGALVFDAASNSMYCSHCASRFPASAFNNVQENTNQNAYPNYNVGNQQMYGNGMVNNQQMYGNGMTNNQQMYGNGMTDNQQMYGSGIQSNQQMYGNGMVNNQQMYGSRMPSNQQSYGYDSSQEDTMEAEIYTCTACGAELMINNVESATFCAYCGQPTIVFSRVSRMKKPKYLLPFSVTKDQAYGIIKNKLNSGKYVPDSVKNFKVEMIRGIYIPFMLYNVDYYDRQVIKSVHRSGDDSYTYYHYREAGNHFSNITVDASISFNDESSQRLEPYNLKDIQPFNVAYMSGFYADCMDDDGAKMEYTARTRSKELFDKAVLASVSGGSKSIVASNPTATITGSEYVMLPVWFVIFREEGKHYTIMVNGQTGKMVGAVPFNKVKATNQAIVLCTVLSIIFASVFGLFFGNVEMSEDIIKLLVVIVIGVFSLGAALVKTINGYKRSRELTTATQIKHLVSDRQEGN